MQATKINLLKIFSNSDIVFGNMEVPFTTASVKRENKKYLFKSNPELLKVFPDNFIFSIANNHILDYGNEGLRETINHLTERGLRFTGAGKNIEEAGRPVIIECKGKKIGFLAGADERYQPATEKSPGTLPAIAEVMVPIISVLKDKVDILYVSIHLGMEYIPVPTPRMKNIAEICHSTGADVVFFHHAHCVSGYSVGKSKAILWGLGNFLFPEKPNYPFKPWFEAAAWHITHDLIPGDIFLEGEPFIIDENGLPARANKEAGEKIINRIDKLRSSINIRRSLELLTFKTLFQAFLSKSYV